MLFNFSKHSLSTTIPSRCIDVNFDSLSIQIFEFHSGLFKNIIFFCAQPYCSIFTSAAIIHFQIHAVVFSPYAANFPAIYWFPA